MNQITFQGVDRWLGYSSWSGDPVLFWKRPEVNFLFSIYSTDYTQYVAWQSICTLLFFPSVLYFSWHRYEHQKFWPNLRESDYDAVGKDKGVGFNVNVPWNKASSHRNTKKTCLLNTIVSLLYVFIENVIIFFLRFTSFFNLLLTCFLFFYFYYDMNLGFFVFF